LVKQVAKKEQNVYLQWCDLWHHLCWVQKLLCKWGQIHDTLTWDNHIDQLISRLNSACYTIRAIKATLSRLYFSYTHSIIFYGIIFWGNTPNSIKILRKKKKKREL
jgi:hypothetical protein